MYDWEIRMMTEDGRGWVDRDEADAVIERLQLAVDKAHDAMDSSAYVGGPSEKEAWQTAMRELGSVVTQYKGMVERDA